MEIFQELKEAGNAAYARNDRKAAIDSYKEAIGHLEKMLFKGVADAEEREKTVNEMTAVCYSNLAATRLIPGDGIDAEGAVADAELALKSDADYAKAYDDDFFFESSSFLAHMSIYYSDIFDFLVHTKLSEILIKHKKLSPGHCDAHNWRTMPDW